MQQKRQKEWFDDDSFWKNTYDFMFPEARFANAMEQVDKLLALAEPKGKTVLDLCCGPGRCAIPLAQKAYTVTGVDRTKFLLNIAYKRAKKVAVNIEWIQQDMRDFVRPDFYDLGLSMFTSFGYFIDKEDDIKVLENIYTSLKPGGSCLIDVMGKERLAGGFRDSAYEILPDGSKMAEYREICDDWTRIACEWNIIRNGKVKSYRFYHTIYSGQELKDRLEKVGFTDIKLYGNFDGDAYGLNAKRLIAVGLKPG